MEVLPVYLLLTLLQTLAAAWSFVHHHRRTFVHSMLFASARIIGAFCVLLLVGFVRKAQTSRKWASDRNSLQPPENTFAVLRWPTRAEWPTVLLMGTLGVSVNEVLLPSAKSQPYFTLFMPFH